MPYFPFTGRQILATAVAICTAISFAATAAPVWIIAGGQEGQGYAFTLGSSCYVITAAHVVAQTKERVALIDMDAYRTTAGVLKADSELDLALLEVVDASAQRKLCASGRLDYMLQIDPLISTMRRDGHDIWLDRIASAAGGLDRMELTLGPQPPKANTLDVVTKAGNDAAHHGRLPAKGDSGSSVWAHDRARTEHYRYTRKGVLVPQPPGNLLGVFIAVEGKAARIVRSDRVHEFIFNTLQPIRWDDIHVEPDDVRTVMRGRGPIPARSHEQELSMSARLLDEMSFELDLGKRDRILSSIEIELSATDARVGARRYRPPTVQVMTSQYRPGENGQWIKDVCRPAIPTRIQLGGEKTLTCALLRPRVARGVRLEIAGHPSNLRRIRLLLED